MPETSVLPGEVAKFDALAAEWRNPRGPMRPLHAMNPFRTRWIDTQLRAHGLAGTTLLDAGCGAGLAAEALAAMGYTVHGIDAAPAPLAVARTLAPPGLNLTYEQATAESLAATGATFGAIVALEIVEHVADPAAFIATLATLLRPGGALVLSTLNRTAASYATAKIGAEYLLRLLPPGTHAWRKFVSPAELAAYCRAAGLTVACLTGMRPAGRDSWQATTSLSVNYMLCATAFP